MGKRSIMLGVCHHDDSRTFFVEFRQQIHYFGTIFRVKITCRLIGQNQLGIGDHRTGNSYTLLLATGKLLRKMFGTMADVHAFQHILYHTAAFGGLDA